ncbi:hypothetical protein [Halobellus sp. EA9]|uniref:hypothetical protein n=1 Tax=Halobellus sp. EA9 TaxID=3421647 RepID=UPI003EBB1878
MTADARAGGRLRVGLGAAIREFVREPINLALILALPPVVIASYESVLSAFPRLPYMTTDPEALGATAGTLFVAAFLPGVIGLFQVISAQRADERLSLAGFSTPVLFASRLAAVCLAAVVTAALSLAVLATSTEVEALALGFLTLAFVGGLYGLVGMLIGTVLPRELEGSLALIFVVDVDEALASGVMATDAAATKLFPLHYPHQVFRAAVDGRAPDLVDLVAAGTYGLVVLATTFFVYTVLAGTGGETG